MPQNKEPFAVFGWRPLKELRFGSVWFRTDGSILTPEGCNPQSITLTERNVDGVKISKPGGEGAPVTLQGNDAARLTLKYEAGKWWAEGFLPLAQEVPYAPDDNPVPTHALPTYSRAHHDLRPYFWPVIITFIVVGVMALGALFLLREPLAEMVRGKRVDRENKQLELLDKAKREALQRTIREGHTEATKKLTELQATADKYRQDFHAAAGITLDHAIASPKDRPREVHLAILKDRSIAEAWKALLNACVRHDDLASRNDTLRAIEARLRTGAVDYDDEEDLQKVLHWIDEHTRALNAQAGNLERLRLRLVQERAALEEERRTP